MTQNELKKILKINTLNEKLKNVLCFINENTIDTEIYNGQISPSNLLAFVSKMYSSEKTAEILFSGNNAIYRAINTKPMQTAMFYNIYSLDFVPPITDISVLLSEKYLEVAPIEWTEKYIFRNSIFYLKKYGKGFRVISDEEDYFSLREDYINVFDENVTALEYALKNNILENAIKKLSDANI